MRLTPSIFLRPKFLSLHTRGLFFQHQPPSPHSFSFAMAAQSGLHTSASLQAANAPTFASMEGQLDPAILRGLKEMKFNFMTPVQEQVLQKLPSMGSDCLVQAKTGTGKTIAFLIPAIQNILQHSTRKGQVSILVLSPTRELAVQIADEAKLLVSKFKRPIEVHTAFGGTAKESALGKFKLGDPKILVATPGRLNDYLSEGNVRAKFDDIKTLILDEADRMLDAGFLPAILQILHALPPKSGPKGQWQGMCFSATVPPKMEQVFAHILSKDHIAVSTIDKSEPPTLAKVPQFFVLIPKVEQTFTALYSILKEEIKATEGDPKIIVFGTTAKLVALYAKIYDGQLSLPVFELHSRLTQTARTRATAAFKETKTGIMFASDVIGRGMDFPDVSLVLQVGLPADADAYTHRVGRTARAGKDGKAILLLTEAESFYLKANRQFPIQPYPHSDTVINEVSAATINDVLQTIEPEVKQKAYSAYLGFMKVATTKMRMTPEQLVHMANEFAVDGMGCEEVPPMEKSTIAKMGLKGVRGINYATKNPTPAQRGPASFAKAAQAPPKARDGPRGAKSREKQFPSSNSMLARPRHKGQHRGKGGSGDAEGW